MADATRDDHDAARSGGGSVLPVTLPPPRRVFSLAAAPATGVRVMGIEVTQAVQNMAHGVRLVAGKTTVARVYLQPRNLSANIAVRGEIAVAAKPGAPARYVASSNSVRLQAAGHPDLAAQRRDATTSLNFVLPTPVAGALVVRLNRIVPRAGGDDVPIDDGPGRERRVAFEDGVPLRVRAIGLRYTDPRRQPPTTHAPDALHFDYFRSFLLRAYPCTGIQWSQIVVAAPRRFVPPFSGDPLPDGSDPLWERLLNIIHNFMLQLRQSEINAGRDPRTHYFGLISDEAGFFRGAANTVPVNANPGVVAVGPVGRPRNSFKWDDDLSYADWYGAHELAHSFGAFHPGFCNGQPRDPRSTFPYADGRLSDGTEDCVGFDVGDATLSLPMRAYAHEIWHDVMTYCEYQWVSKHTYDALYDRLGLEARRFAPPGS